MSVSIKCSVLLVGCSLWPAAASADPIKVRQTISKAGIATDIGETRIVVDGEGVDKYDHVVTRTVDAWVTISGDRPEGGAGTRDGIVRIEGGKAEFGKLAGEPKIYKISFPYRDPKSASVANMRVSPVALCNNRLAALHGGSREKFLKQGDLFFYPDAWTASASIVWVILDTKGAFRDPPAHKSYSATAPVGTSIECRALDRPKVRMKKTTAQKGGTTPPAKKMDPTIKSATLRIEPAMVERIGRDMCPTQLRLYGQVVTIRPFRGSAIILGKGYLSPVTSLNFPTAGARSVRGTYSLKWNDGPPGSLSAGGSAAPRSQSVSLRMNVANEDNKVIETASETIKVSCKRAPPTRV